MPDKADKATTLAGYGITDAYTKTEADTLLGAKANDNAVVHLAGGETITGLKNLKIAGSDIIFLNTQSTVLDQSATGTEGRMRMRWSDKNGTGSDNRVVEISTYRRAGGNNTLYLTQFNKVGGSLASDGLAITLNTDGTAYMMGPSRGYNAGSTYSSDVATIGTLDAYTPMVRTTGNQDISGLKKFNAIEADQVRGKLSGFHGRLTGTSKAELCRYKVDGALNTVIYMLVNARGIGMIGTLNLAYDGASTVAIPSREPRPTAN